ncbi:tetratricopeptide repeat protein [Ancylomarina sp. 16SWW S1-10-2]|uniref:tetratricopeptide repeat protein n=1 Tax=Ancylomarina sp. 16SWW S1-10-2 TaxID=2499681 RepID=UPI0012AD3A0C|nr:tetratricopeptide repeat protein [Ancylomarina sp. 16SWW S1-10-2]MRT93996.1 tetratricopeptide repeat protein [Ancylomarina sp. 16SWW S1-10-2]
MSTNKNNQDHEDNFENFEQALSRTEQYIEKNQKKLTYIAIAVILVATAIFAYQKYYRAPMEINAQTEMFQAQRYFEVDSFNLAINGDGNYDGFLDIIDNYGSTEAGNLSNYYVGVSYLHLGEYQNAINYLENFSSDDFLLSSLAKAAIGDAYMELGNNEKAASNYMNASASNTNDFTTPIYLQKAGFAYEMTGNYKEALAAYETIEKDFGKSSEARDIEKYITRAKLNLK